MTCKKVFCLLLTVLFLLSLCACDAQEEKEKTEVFVFAASSLCDALTAIAEDYSARNGDVELIFSFDSSGTLKTQIEEGADCDLFLSAALKQMDQLEAARLLAEGSRLELLENRVVLSVPEENPANIRSYEDLAGRLKDGDILLAMGNADVPVGQYTNRILAFFGLSEAELAKAGLLSYGSNVREVTSQIAEGSVDCGVIYETDAAAAALSFVDTASESMCGRVLYPAALIKNSAHLEAAEDFLAYLSSEAAAERFRDFGFFPLG